MDEAMNELLQNMEKESERKSLTMERLLSAADASRVFSQPVSSGEYTVITAAEVAGGGGFGSGMGLRDTAGAGTGGGGGGGSIGRPVAAIVVGPEGVEVKQILDVTKVGLAALTAFGALATIAFRRLGK